jgi:hypothetical protein
LGVRSQDTMKPHPTRYPGPSPAEALPAGVGGLEPNGAPACRERFMSGLEIIFFGLIATIAASSVVWVLWLSHDPKG